MSMSDYIRLLVPLGTVVDLALALILAVLAVTRRLKPQSKRIIGYVLFVGYICVFCRGMLFGRVDVSWKSLILLEPFWSYRKALSLEGGLHVVDTWLFCEIIVNYLLFCPVACFLAFLWPIRFYDCGRMRGLAHVMLVGFAFSLVIESLQLGMRVGYFEIDDIFNNTLGTAVGYLLYCGCLWVVQRLIGRRGAANNRSDDVLPTDIEMPGKHSSRIDWWLAVESLGLVLASFVLTGLGFSEAHPYVLAAAWLLVCSVIVYQLGSIVSQGTFELVGFVSSYALKAAIAVARLVRNGSIRFITSGKDSYAFWQIASEYRRGVFEHQRSRYPYVLAAEFQVVGENYLCCMLVNVMLTVVAAAVVLRTLRHLGIEGKVRRIAVLLMCFWPYNVLTASEILREPIYVLFISLSLLAFVRYLGEERYGLLIGALVSMLPVLVLHGGYFPIALVYLLSAELQLARSLHRVASRHGRHLSSSADTNQNRRFLLVNTVLIVLGIVAFALLDPKEIVRKAFDPTGLMSQLSGLTSSDVVTSAGSAYLTDMHVDTWPKVFLYAPIRLLYFYVSPVPADWRGLADAITFCGDSIIHGWCLCQLLWCVIARHDWLHRHLAVTILAALVLCGVVFGYGTFTAGTAIRHRDVLCSLEVVALALCMSYGWTQTPGTNRTEISPSQGCSLSIQR